MPGVHAVQRHGPDDLDGGFTRHAALLLHPAILARCIYLIGDSPNCDVQQTVACLACFHSSGLGAGRQKLHPDGWDGRALGRGDHVT